MEFRNGILLQLFECIESTQNEVKRKMIETGACNAAPKSLHALRAWEFFRRRSFVGSRQQTYERPTAIGQRLSSLSGIYNQRQI
jgi:hypothetical protein